MICPRGRVKHRQVPAGSNSPSVLPWVKNGEKQLVVQMATLQRNSRLLCLLLKVKMVKREVSQGSSLCIGKSHQNPTFCGHGPMVKHRKVQSSRFYIASCAYR